MKILTHKNIYIRALTKPDAKADIWLLHGLGESSLCYRKGFELLKDTNYNLYAPDFPGFGASPPQDNCQTIAQLVDILQSTITTLSPNRPLHLIGHSMSGIVATELCHTLKISTPTTSSSESTPLEELDYTLWGTRVKSLTNIEGTIALPPDVSQRLTGLTPATSVQEFTDVFVDYIQSSPSIISYIASLNFSDPQTLTNFALETYQSSGTSKSGKRYMDLEIPKLYIYGTNSWTIETVRFLKNNNLDTIELNAGHWPMIDQPEQCYQAILNFIESTPS